MASLPKSRFDIKRPFHDTAVDTFGEFYIYIENAEGIEYKKVWACVFVCLATRACHVELLRNMSTEEFLLAFRRFAARYTLPTNLMSDNGTNYIGAEREITQLFNCLDVNKLQKEFPTVSWEMVTPLSPWRNAAAERLIQICKRAFRKVVGKAHLDYVEMETILLEICQTINNRPLTAVPSEGQALNAITPNKLIFGFNSEAFPEIIPLKEYQDADVMQRFKHRLIVKEHFDNRFRKEYLTELNYFNKWHKEDPKVPRVGQAVLINDKSIKNREFWTLGMITKLYEGRDGRVRSADVRTTVRKDDNVEYRVYKRPLNLLHPMEFDVGPDGKILRDE
jgi:hypothetical protein